MSSRSEGQDQNQGTEAVDQKDYIIDDNLLDFIQEVQKEANIDDETIRKITRDIKLSDIRMERLRDTDEFVIRFRTGMAFNMCFLDLQTEEGIVHQNTAKNLELACRWKTNEWGTYEDKTAWIVDIFCYDDLTRPTPFALAVTLLDRVMDRFYNELVTKKITPKPLRVSHYSSEEVEPGFQKAIEILLSLVLQIFEQFPDVSLNFIISGITTDYPEPQKLATLVLMLGRLMNKVRVAGRESRLKVIFCGNGFLRPFEKKGAHMMKKEDPLLIQVQRLMREQGKVEIQDRIVKAITDRMLILKWSEKHGKWFNLEIKTDIISNALVPFSGALVDD